MSLKNPIYTEFDLNATSGYSKIISLTHTDDDNVDVIELCVKQSGAQTDLTGATVIARMVLHGSPDVLISDNVACTINDAGNILIPFDNASIESRKGIVKIEVNVTREPDILTLQLPLWVKINGSILESATIDPHSEGTIPELLKEAAEELERVQGFITIDDLYEILNSTLQGDPNIAPSLYVSANQSGSYSLVYMDSDDHLHTIFDFSNLPSGSSDYEDLENKPTINGDDFIGELEFSSTEFDVSKLTEESNVKFLVSISRILGSKVSDVPFSSLSTDLQDGLFCEVPESTLANDSYGRNLNYWGAFSGKSQGNGNIIVRISTPSNFRNLPAYIAENYKTCVVISSTQEGNDRGVCLQLVFTSNDNNGIKIFGRYGKTSASFTNSWQELLNINIVSGVVNQNGTITFTNSDGTTFTTTGSSVIGFSPTATVTQTQSGATVSITDKNGTTTANISNGDNYVLTAQDKSDIADIVLGELPNADVMSF